MAQHPASNADREKIMNNNSQQTFAQRFALVLLAASLMALPFYYYLATKSDSWQLTALFYINIPFVIANSLGLWLARRGRIALSVCLILGVMGLVVVAASLLISGIGIIAGLGFPILAFFVASHTLSRREATWIDIYSVFVGGASIVANSFSQSTQITIPSVQIALPVMALILVLLAGVTLFRRFSSFPLRIKLFVVLVGVALFSIAAVAFTTYQVISKEIQQQAGASLSSVANGKALEIGATLNRSKNTMESLVLNETLQDYLKATNVKSTSDPAYLAILDKQWIAAKDETDPLIRNALNNQTADELRVYQRRFPEFVEIFLTNKFGGNIASTSRTSDYYQADEDWWQAAWNDGMGGFYISLPQFDESTGLYAIDLALPVYAEPTSEIIGILRATINVTALKDTLRAGAFGRTGKVDLVFPNKRFLQGDTTNKVMMLSPKSANQLDTLRESFGLFNYEDQPSLVSKNLVSTNNAKDKGAVESLGWYVVAHQDTAEALEPAAIVVRSIVLTALAILLLASAFAFYIGRQLTIPLTQLTSAAVKVSEGDLTVQASVTSKDEIGILASTFNSMTVQLQNLIGTLEQRVAERTRALSTVADVGTTATTILETDKLLQEVVDLSKERFGFYHSHIYLLNDEGDTLVLASGAGEVGRQMVAEGRSIPLDRERSLVARAARQRKGVTVNDITAAPDFLPNPLLPNTHSELAVPMIVGEQVIGVFDVQSDAVGRFTEADIAVQTTLASQIASAVQNARLYTQAEYSASEARSLVENAPEAIVVVDLATGLFTDPNENAVKLYGLPREELTKVGPAQMSPPTQPDGCNSTEKAMEKIGDAMQGKFPVFDWTHRNAQGQDIHCEVRLVQMPGDRPRVRASVTDITERKHLQELTAQHARQQEAINLITQRIQATATIEDALQVAARELGHALGKRPTLVVLDASLLAGESNHH